MQQPQPQPQQQQQQPRQGPPAPQPGPGTDFKLLEERSGVRFSWHVWPHSPSEADSLAAPLGLLYSPMKPIDDLERIERDPVRCGHCAAVLKIIYVTIL